MTELLFYAKPVALHREQHRNLRFRRLPDLSFSRQVNSVPLAGLEFFEASRDMTVLFNRDPAGRYFPLVLLSLDNAGHGLVGEDGRWRANYVPAFIRRYPFALAANGALCYDASCTAFGEEPEGERLFDDEGKTTPFTDGVLRFLQRYEFESKRTREFCEAVAGKDLFKPFQAQVKRGRGAVRLEGLYCIDEEAFSKIDAATLEDWFRKGWIAWAYAHLHSIGALGQISRQGAPVS